MELLIWTRNPRLTWISPSSSTQLTPKLMTRSGSTSRSRILSFVYRGRWTSTDSSDLVTSRTAWWKSASPGLLSSTLARTSPRCSLARVVACRGREVPGVIPTSLNARRRNGRVESPEGALPALPPGDGARTWPPGAVPGDGTFGTGRARHRVWVLWRRAVQLRLPGAAGIDGGNHASTGHRSRGRGERRRQDGLSLIHISEPTR